MAKTLTPYSGLTASGIVAKATSGICDLVVNGSNVDASNVSLNGVKNVIGDSAPSLAGVCQSANVNIYSGFSPRVWVMASTVYSTPRTPYSLGSFAGYKHNASTPSLSCTNPINLNSTYANASYNLSLDLNLGEVNWAADLGYDYCIMKVNGNTDTSSAFALSSYTANTTKNVICSVTCPAAGGSSNFEVQAWFGSSTNATGRLTPATASTTINVAIAAYYANHLIVDSQANRDIVDALGSPYCDYPTEYCAMLDTTITNKSLSSTTLADYYTVLADIHRSSDGAHLRTINIPHRYIHCDFIMYKINGSTQSSDYTIASSQWIQYTSGGWSQSYAIPVALQSPVDNDRFYMKFDNLW